MRASSPFIIALVFAISANVRADDPQELKAARIRYQQAFQHATEPLKARYMSDLVRLRDAYTKSGKLAEAVAVNNEIGVLNGKPPEQSLEVAATPSKAAGAIAARSDIGLPLGSAKKGQRIRVQYVSGTWSSTGGPPVSPDDAPHAFVKVAVVGLINGEEEVAMVIPNGTKSHAFSEDFKKDYEQVWLRINDHTKSDNVGEVTYKVSIK